MGIMSVKNFNQIYPYCNILPIDTNGREINIYKIKSVIFTTNFIHYPNVMVYSHDAQESYSVINEQIMSLRSEQTSTRNIEFLSHTQIETTPMFLFTYNIDNYFHFVYDTLPYLISYKKLKESIPNLKLLLNYTHPDIKSLYKFVSEFLEILDITDKNIAFVHKNTMYKELYISNSYTHDSKSELPPRAEIYDLYKQIKQKASSSIITPKKIYVSRRSWLHGNYTNIGTNYTTRRRMTNENELVKYLESRGFVEVFAEQLNTADKLAYFNNAEIIVGAIGGGMCNALFSNKTCKLVAINSPGFLDVNKRFEFTFRNTKHIPFNDTFHTEQRDIKLYTRVKVGDIVGEVIDITENNLTISYNDDIAVAGWNNNIKYKNKVVNIKNCQKIDNGLNSSWALNLTEFKKLHL